MIYDKNGNVLNSAYDKNGQSLLSAYDIEGNQIFSAVEPEPTTIKVMTYNVGGWYIGSGRNVPSAQKTEYLALQIGMIEDADPDVLMIQEYLANFSDDGTSALSMLRDLFPYVHAVASGTYFGRACCSKYPITNYTERTYTGEPSRYFDSCTITIEGVPITFVNTHLGLTQANRTPEINQLISYLDTLNRFIACGDYNTGITVDTANTSSAAYIDNVKPFIDKGFKSVNFSDFGFLMTCVDRINGTLCYIDNIYTSSNINILSASVDTTKQTDSINDPIDHMPLIATLELN